MIFWLIAAIFFICMQGFFSGMETGMVSVMRPRAEHAAKNLPGKKHRRMLFFLDHSGIMISTTLIGVNSSVVLASLSFKKFLESCGFSGGAWIAAATVFLSLILLTAELISKNWFRQSPYDRCSKCVILLYRFWCVMKPVVLAFSALTSLFDRILGGGKPQGAKGAMAEDFQLFVRESVGYGSIDTQTAEVLRHVMSLPRIRLKDIAAPVSQVPVIPARASVAEAFETARQCNLDKLPVCSADDRTKIIGIFDAYDVIFRLEPDVWNTTPVTGCMAGISLLDEADDPSGAVELSRHGRVGMFVIVDKDGNQTGVLSPDKIADMLFQ